MSESEHQPTDDTSKLLTLISDVIAELHPRGIDKNTIHLDSRLDKDLGLDSLARVELLARIEKIFDISLPDTIFSEAETPRDLLRVIATANQAPVGKSIRMSSISAETLHQTDTRVSPDGATPDRAMTLMDVLDWHVQTHPDHPHIRFYNDDNDGEVLSYRELAEEAQNIAAGLLNRDIQPGQAVAIMLPTGRDYFVSFYGILIAGAIPVPVYPPARMSQLEEHLKRHTAILQNCQAAALITVPEAIGVAKLLRAQVDSLHQVITAKELSQTIGALIKPASNPNDIAFLQYTSGSTGSPKGVILTHANLLANIRAYGKAMEIQRLH